MSDIWAHSHEWDNGYAKGHKDGYQQGRADAIDEFLLHLKSSATIRRFWGLYAEFDEIAEQLKEQTDE